MKTKFGLVVTFVFSLSAIAVAVENSETRDGNSRSVLESSFFVQDDQIPPAPVPESSVPVAPVPQAADIPAPAPVPMPGQTVMEGPAVMLPPMMAAPVPGMGCNTCCVTPCRCCPPAPKSLTYCLQDPCGCMHEATICVPGCCLGEEPCISWRKGVFGRQIATLCWNCCDHKVTVIVTRKGKVKVRG